MRKNFYTFSVHFGSHMPDRWFLVRGEDLKDATATLARVLALSMDDTGTYIMPDWVTVVSSDITWMLDDPDIPYIEM